MHVNLTWVISAAANRFRKGYLAALALGVVMAGVSQTSAQPFRIESFQLGPQSQFTFSVPRDTNSYYRLLGGEQTTNVQTVIALSLTNTLVALQAPNNAQFFYRAQRIDLATPHDSDGDGIDDLWELGHGLDPLNSGDAAQLAPGDTRTWLEVYMDEQAVTFDYQYPSDQAGRFETLVQDPISGVVYALLYATSGDGNQALVLKSTDGGINWETNPPVLDYLFGTNWGDHVTALAADASGNLYAAEQTFNPPGVIVLKNAGGGTNWSLSDRYSGEPNWGTLDLFDFEVAAADRDGNVYVAGRAVESKTYCQQCPSIQNWFVRKFTASSNSWATVDVFSRNYGGWPTAVACGPAGSVFVVGTSGTASLNNFLWVVRRSLDGGASWKTVDTLVNGNPYPQGIATDAKGNVYVVGGYFTSGPEHWLVRASTDGGNIWRTIDDPALDGNGAWARSIGVDSKGRLNVIGAFSDTSDVGHSLLRRSSDGGATWFNVDDVVDGAALFYYPTTIFALPDGSTLAGGRSSLTGDYLVRRLPPPPPK